VRPQFAKPAIQAANSVPQALEPVRIRYWQNHIPTDSVHQRGHACVVQSFPNNSQTRERQISGEAQVHD
jgi:hypothetical protein